jgi:hypothetical protein
MGSCRTGPNIGSLRKCLRPPDFMNAADIVKPHSRRETACVIAVAVMLCACSVAQFSLASILVNYAKQRIEAASATPPIGTTVVVQAWASVMRWPWEAAMAIAYGALCVRRRHGHLVAGRIRALWYLWMFLNTSFFILVYFAALPFRTCCI